MAAFENFWGNEAVALTLANMIESGRIPQTILLGGPEGIGKATLARRFAAQILGDSAKIEQDDLSVEANLEVMEQRERLSAEKRAEDPLLFSTHPDFVTFPPDGPLRQISIQQIRLLKEQSQLKPLRGDRRVFLIDHLDRANEQAANSLLKLLEEPPPHLIVIATAENLYDLLPTIRSRSIVMSLARLSEAEMREFVDSRDFPDPDLRVALAEGCPGLASRLDLKEYRERRAVMLALFESAAGVAPFGSWVQKSESFASRKTEKLEFYLKTAYGLLEDLLLIWQGQTAVKNHDIQAPLSAIAERVNFRWLEEAVKAMDELAMMVRRNIQKIIVLDAIIMNLRNLVERSNAY